METQVGLMKAKKSKKCGWWRSENYTFNFASIAVSILSFPIRSSMFITIFLPILARRVN